MKRKLSPITDQMVEKKQKQAITILPLGIQKIIIGYAYIPESFMMQSIKGVDFANEQTVRSDSMHYCPMSRVYETGRLFVECNFPDESGCNQIGLISSAFQTVMKVGDRSFNELLCLMISQTQRVSVESAPTKASPQFNLLGGIVYGYRAKTIHVQLNDGRVRWRFTDGLGATTTPWSKYIPIPIPLPCRFWAQVSYGSCNISSLLELGATDADYA
jgi:hypothetical protein